MGSAASKRGDNGSGSGSGGGSASGRSLHSKRTLTKKQKQKQQQSGALGLPESQWSSPFRFRQLWDEDGESLILPGAAAPPHSFAPNATAVAAAYSAEQDQLNELFFAVSSNSQWQQQQVRGLFAAYQEACLHTKDRVLNLAAFSDYFFSPSSHHHYPAAVIRKAYALFDADEDGLISFLDFVQGVSRCVHGQRRHKVRLVFELFDADCDGLWSAEEAGAFLRAAMTYIKHLTQDAVEEVHWRDMLQDEQHDWWQQQLRQMQTHMEQQQQATTATPAAAAAAVSHTRANATDAAAAATSIPVRPASSRESGRTGVSSSSRPLQISLGAFRAWARTHLRVKPLLASRFDVLPSASEERARIAALWSAHDTLRLGDTWFALSESWWRAWKAFSGFREPGEAEDDSAAAATSATAANGDASRLRSGASASASASPPYLISDTDTDSDCEQLDRELAATGAAAVAAPSSAGGSASGSTVSTPATPQTQRKLSRTRTVHSPGAIQIGLASTSGGGVGGDTTQAASAVASATASRRNSTSAAGTGGVSLHMTPHGAAVATAAHGSSAHAAAASSPAAGFPMQSPSPSNGAQNGRSPAAPRPTAIDLSDLACRRNPLLLRQPLLEHEDFLLVHERVWAQLVRWYGLAGAHVFPRTVVEVGRDGARTKRVELYPLCLRVQRVGRDAPKPLPAPGVPVEGACLLFPSPSATSVRQLEARMLQLFYPSPPPLPQPSAVPGADRGKAKGKGKDSPSLDLPPGDLRMWVRDSNDWRCLLLEDMPKTLEALELQNDDTVLVELEREPLVPDGGGGKRKKAPPAPTGTGPHKWHMEKRKMPRPFTQFEVGDQLDARDKQDVWYNAVIRRVVPPVAPASDAAAAGGSGAASGSGSGTDVGSVVVSFVGWDEKWNEVLPAGSICRCRGPCRCTGRLAPLDAQVRFKAAAPSSATAASASAAAAASAVAAGFSGPPSPDAGHPSLTSPGQPVRGLCGLSNLGNTCFLSSIVQCLSHTPLFCGGSSSSYFLSGKFNKELNKSNALGHRGLVAQEFGALVQELWSGQWRSTQPTRFKRVISDFAPQFDGYQQHDSHELLAFLLDGLHEDLNRVLKKVTTAPVESRGRPDAVVVRETWAQYKIRNQSIVVDLFMGMLKSTVVCPSPSHSGAAGGTAGGCGRVSITFDPFRYLTVPIPSVSERSFIVTYCAPDAGPLVNYGIVLPEQNGVGALKARLSSLCGVPAHKLLLCDVHKSKLIRVLMDSKSLASIRDTDVLVAYQIGSDAFRAETKPSETGSALASSTAAESQASMTVSASSSSSSSSSSSLSSSSSHSHGSSSSRSSSPLSVAPPSLRSDMVYLQAIHKYIVADARTGHATMSPRFGIPVCLTTTPHTSSRRVHQLLAQAIQRWAPPQQSQSQPSYTVRVVDHTCSRCGFCAESSNCGGCCLAEDDRPCGLDGGFALCVLWESESVARAVKLAMDDSRIRDDASVSARPRDLATHPILLRECIELFAHREVLAKSEAWYCSSCKAHRTATKQLQIYHAPEILVVHLKRFQQINRLRREKHSAFVDFPLRGLDLAPYIPPHALDNQPAPVYDLYAVSNHSGGLSGGHYTSFCLHAETRKWYLFDDSRVTPVADANSVRTSAAYCLFYKRRA